jgi:5'-3' exoribonuclease 1
MQFCFTDTDVSAFEGQSECRDNLYHIEFRQHKREYYIRKLGYPSVTAEVLNEQAEGYVRAIQWNLHYYYNGCVSWSWYYPHHYAPWITDIRGVAETKMVFDLGHPFLPFEQLLSVLPAASKDLLPPLLQGLMINPSSPILDFYPKDFENDLNGKQQEWEAVVLVPFIDEKRLQEASTPLFSHLTKEEQSRKKLYFTCVKVISTTLCVASFRQQTWPYACL